MPEPERPYKDSDLRELWHKEKTLQNRVAYTESVHLPDETAIADLFEVRYEIHLRTSGQAEPGPKIAAREERVLQLAQGLFGRYLESDSDEDAAKKAIKTARVFFKEWDAQKP